MSELAFNGTREEDGGYSAAAVGQFIFTPGDRWEDLRANAEEAVQAHYYQDLSKKPERVQLLLV